MEKSDIEYWIDHASEHSENNGIQRVSRYLSRGLQELGRDLDFQLAFRCWDERKRRPRDATRRELKSFARWNGPPLAPRFQGWRKPASGRSWLIVPETTYTTRTSVLRPSDLASALIDEAHERGLRAAFLFYDLLPLTIEVPEPHRLRHEQYVRALGKADLVLPISRHAAAELSHFFRDRGVSAPPIKACQLADEFVGWQRTTAVVEPPDTGFIEFFCVSSMSERKNQRGLIRAFNAFCREHPSARARLTLVGHFYRPWLDEIERLIAGNPLVALSGFADDAGLVDLYRRSHFTVFPSLAEGYGMPIVESLWFGRPCLCANFGAMAEAGAGGGCLRVDTRSDEALKDGLARLILDTDLRRRLCREATARPMRTWTEYAASVLAALAFAGADELGVDAL